MADTGTFGFSETVARDLKRSLGGSENLVSRRGGVIPADSQVIRITSATPDGDGFYPGFIQRFNPATLLWEDGDPCKVVDANA